jgi:hypothetical protein
MISTTEIMGFATKAVGIFALVVIGLVAVTLIVLGIMWYSKRKRYNILVRIKQEDPIGSGHLKETDTDMGGIFMDKKTSNRLFLLKKYKVGMKPDEIPTYDGPGIKIVEVLQLSLKSFRYLQSPKVIVNSPAALTYQVQDYDVAWATNEVDRLKLYQKKSVFDKIKDVLPIIIVFFMSILIIYFFLSKFSVLSDIATKLQTVSENLKVVADSSGQHITTIVGK